MEQIANLISNQGLAIALIIILIMGAYSFFKHAVPKLYNNFREDAKRQEDRIKKQDERLDNMEVNAERRFTNLEGKVDKLEVVIENNTKVIEKFYQFLSKEK